MALIKRVVVDDVEPPTRHVDVARRLIFRAMQLKKPIPLDAREYLAIRRSGYMEALYQGVEITVFKSRGRRYLMVKAVSH